MTAENHRKVSPRLSKLPLSPSPSPLSQNRSPKTSASQDLSSNHTLISSSQTQSSCRRSPRLLVNGQEPPAKKQKIPESWKNKGKGSGIVSFFIGDPVPEDEARQRWPWRAC
ncbi:unnamed protein product [Ilex paraguariensis]|uniref:Uncharacterized protein n=1 Tax=Ilex paraguariensis TaxID=185542 RepID=A0ABC8TY83_9AQUA